jgi:hypothetical protein
VRDKGSPLGNFRCAIDLLYNLFRIMVVVERKEPARVTLLIGPGVGTAALIALKFIFLASATGSSLTRVVCELGLAEVTNLALICSATSLVSFFCHKLLRISAKILLIAAAGWLLFDTGTIITLDRRVSLSDIMRLSNESTIVTSFLTTWGCCGIVAWALLQFIHIKVIPSVAIRLAAIGFVVVMICTMLPNSGSTFYRLYAPPTLRSLLINSVKKAEEFYTADQVANYAEMPRSPSPLWLDNNPNLILLIIESLSSVNSKRFGGLYDHTPGFDRISQKGHYFTRFLANYYDTEGGLVSLLNMRPPLPIPGNSRDIFDLYGDEESILPFLKQRGYFTSFITTAPLSFLKKGRYLQRLRFDVALGRDEVEEFKVAPKYTFASPADAVLYERLLKEVDRNAVSSVKPIFLTAVTVSSHLPWKNPKGGENTAEQVWRYVDDQFVWFYEELDRRKFFEHGILIVTGDHRQMTAIQEAEWKKFGGSARVRVPLTLIGKGIAVGKNDERMFQQADLLRKIGVIQNPNEVLTESIVVPESYTSPSLRTGSSVIGFDVFTPLGNVWDNFAGYFYGSSITWQPNVPWQVRNLEDHIHRQRALLQESVRKRIPLQAVNTCEGPSAVPEQLQGRRGFVFRRLVGEDVAKVLSPEIASSVEYSDHISFEHRAAQPFGTLGESRVIAAHSEFTASESGTYFFRMITPYSACLFIGSETVVSVPKQKQFSISEGWITLAAGKHILEVRYLPDAQNGLLKLQWNTPRTRKWRTFYPSEKDQESTDTR